MRTLALLFLTAALALTLACGGTKKDAEGIDQDPIEFEDPPERPKGEGPPVERPAHLTIVPMTIKANGQVLTIDSEGKIEGAGKHIGTVTKGGEFLASNEGLYGTLMPDGSMIAAHVKLGRFDGILVSESGVLQKKDSESGEMANLNEISETGEVSENGVVGFTLEGPPEGRRAAIFVYLTLVALAMDSQEAAAGAAPDGAPDAAKTPSE